MAKTWNARKNKYHAFFQIIAALLNSFIKEYKFHLKNYKYRFDKWNANDYEKINNLTIKKLIKKFSNNKIKEIIDNIEDDNKLKMIFDLKFNEFFNVNLNKKELYENYKLEKKTKKKFKRLTNEKFFSLNKDNNNIIIFKNKNNNNNNNNKIFLIKKIYLFEICDSFEYKNAQIIKKTIKFEYLKKFICEKWIDFIDNIINDKEKNVEIINNSTKETSFNDNNNNQYDKYLEGLNTENDNIDLNKSDLFAFNLLDSNWNNLELYSLY